MDSKQHYTSAVLTISDKGSRGERQDTSGPQLKKQLTHNNFEIVDYNIVPDSIDAIQKILLQWIDEDKIDLVITTGGTGVSPTDVTPEATAPILDKQIPGIAEVMRMTSHTKTVNAVLSRGLAGVRRKSLIINLPGSEKAARENLDAVLPSLAHAIYKIQGGKKDCAECT